MKNPLKVMVDAFVLTMLKRRMRKHGYTERVINTVVSYYSRPKPRYDFKIIWGNEDAL